MIDSRIVAAGREAREAAVAAGANQALADAAAGFAAEHARWWLFALAAGDNRALGGCTDRVRGLALRDDAARALDRVGQRLGCVLPRMTEHQI
jgi:hypothetical protein